MTEPALPLLPPLTTPPKDVDDLKRAVTDLYYGILTFYPILAGRLDAMIMYGLAADIPAADGSGRFFYATDTDTLYFDDGAWNEVGAGASADATYFTDTDESATLPSSLQLAFGSGLAVAAVGSLRTVSAPPTYALMVSASDLNPADGATYYFGGLPCWAPQTTEATQRIDVHKSASIKAAYIRMYCAGTTGTSENISIYIRKNGTTDTLVATVGSIDNPRIFSNTGLDIAVVQGDFLEIKMVCPTWSTDPTSVKFGGVLYLE
jgi:hypothetical protein